MSAVGADALATYGGPLFDYSAVIDATRDRPASGANAAYAAVAGLSHPAPLAWVSFTVNGTGAPVLVAHDARWGNAIGVAPVPTRSSPGVYVVTWPVNVQDEIPIGFPGYRGPLPLNLRAGWPNLRVVATAFDLFVNITSANVATISCFSVAGSLADPGVATGIDVWVI
jgi:hypothetical protein